MEECASSSYLQNAVILSLCEYLDYSFKIILLPIDSFPAPSPISPGILWATSN